MSGDLGALSSRCGLSSPGLACHREGAGCVLVLLQPGLLSLSEGEAFGLRASVFSGSRSCRWKGFSVAGISGATC